MSCVKLVKGSENFLGIYKGYEKFFGSDKGCEKFDRYFKNTPTGYPVLKMTGPLMIVTDVAPKTFRFSTDDNRWHLTPSNRCTKSLCIVIRDSLSIPFQLSTPPSCLLGRCVNSRINSSRLSEAPSSALQHLTFQSKGIRKHNIN